MFGHFCWYAQKKKKPCSSLFKGITENLCEDLWASEKGWEQAANTARLMKVQPSCFNPGGWKELYFSVLLSVNECWTKQQGKRWNTKLCFQAYQSLISQQIPNNWDLLRAHLLMCPLMPCCFLCLLENAPYFIANSCMCSQCASLTVKHSEEFQFLVWFILIFGFWLFWHLAAS